MVSLSLSLSHAENPLLQAGVSTHGVNMRKSRPPSVCELARKRMQAHTRLRTITDGFRSLEALGGKAICSRTARLKNDPDTRPSCKASARLQTSSSHQDFTHLKLA